MHVTSCVDWEMLYESNGKILCLKQIDFPRLMGLVSYLTIFSFPSLVVFLLLFFSAFFYFSIIDKLDFFGQGQNPITACDHFHRRGRNRQQRLAKELYFRRKGVFKRIDNNHVWRRFWPRRHWIWKAWIPRWSLFGTM